MVGRGWGIMGMLSDKLASNLQRARFSQIVVYPVGGEPKLLGLVRRRKHSASHSRRHDGIATASHYQYRRINLPDSPY